MSAWRMDTKITIMPSKEQGSLESPSTINPEEICVTSEEQYFGESAQGSTRSSYSNRLVSGILSVRLNIPHHVIQ